MFGERDCPPVKVGSFYDQELYLKQIYYIFAVNIFKFKYYNYVKVLRSS